MTVNLSHAQVQTEFTAHFILFYTELYCILHHNKTDSLKQSDSNVDVLEMVSRSPWTFGFTQAVIASSFPPSAFHNDTFQDTVTL